MKRRRGKSVINLCFIILFMTIISGCNSVDTPNQPQRPTPSNPPIMEENPSVSEGPWVKQLYTTYLYSLSKRFHAKTKSTEPACDNTLFNNSWERVVSILKCEEVDAQKRYEKFIDYLRESLNNVALQNDVKTNKEMNDLIHIMYREMSMRSFAENLVQKFTKQQKLIYAIDYSNPFSQLDNLLAQIERQEEVHQKIDSTSLLLRTDPFDWAIDNLGRNISYLNFDPSKEGNLTFLKSKIKDLEGKTIYLPRFGTPTIGSYKDQVTINPEFYFYIKNLEQGQRHLYISYQKRQKPNLFVELTSIQNEFYRSMALEDFAELNESKLLFVTIDNNSDFYFQKEPYDTLSGDPFINTFKQMIINANQQNSSYYFPASLNKQKILTLMDQIKNTLFKNKALESIEEKRNFIVLTHAFIELMLLSEEGIISANLTCKDAIDRGASAHVLGSTIMVTLQMIREPNNPANSEFISSLDAFLTSDALIVSGRSILEERLHDYQNASTFFINELKKEGQYEDLLDMFDRQSIKIFQFSLSDRDSSQTVNDDRLN